MASFPRFNATDFSVCETDADVLKEQLRTVAAEYLGYTPADSDPYFVVCLSLLPYFVQTAAAVDAGAKSALMQYASGGELDRIADSIVSYGYLTRRSATAPWLYCYFDFSSYLPASPSASSPELYTFKCTASIEIDGVTYSGESNIYIRRVQSGTRYYYPTQVGFAYFQADTAGAAYNLDYATAYPLSQAHLSDVTVTQNGSEITLTQGAFAICGSAGGRDAETDDEFAERIRKANKAIRVPGCPEYYDICLRELMGLSDCYVSPAPYDIGVSSVDTQYNGALQVYYMPFVPFGCPQAYYQYVDPRDDSDKTLAERVDELLTGIRVAGTKIMVGKAIDAYETLGSTFTFTYHAYSDATGDTIAAIEAAYMQAVRDYTYKCGIVLDFDDIKGRLVAAGAFDVEMTNPGDLANIQLARNKFVPKQKFTSDLTRGTDETRNYSISGTPSANGCRLI